jgi:2-keto-4-pentenoate hydratase/2-oxohepta-3-ene-1,7-dioic acid hydratase in catechol pathway
MRFVAFAIESGHSALRVLTGEEQLVDLTSCAGHVTSYSIFNKGSIRDCQFPTNQWLLGKNFDSSGSFGLIFITADELPPGAGGLDISCGLNGTTVQASNT